MPSNRQYDDEYESLNLMISTSPKSVKEVAAFLFPHLKLESAYARLKACLNPEKDERLTFGQIISAMKFCERFDPIMYACDETMHTRPERRSLDDEKEKYMKDILSQLDGLKKTISRLEGEFGGAQS